jgi:heterodisulfide reductase subunit B
VNLETSVAVSAYNICLAEEADLDMVTLCTGCFESLAMANTLLKEDAKLKTRINKALSEAGKEFKGTKEVKHYLSVLLEDIGIEGIKKKITTKLSNLKVATFPGCHLLRPSELLQFDDPERPKIFDSLIEALGAESLDYRNKLKCCGGLLRGYSDELASEIAREKLQNVSKSGADLISTLCPFCFIALDLGQIQIKANFKEDYAIPVLHYAELLSLALGIEPKELALQTHKIKVDKIVDKLSAR